MFKFVFILFLVLTQFIVAANSNFSGSAAKRFFAACNQSYKNVDVRDENSVTRFEFLSLVHACLKQSGHKFTFFNLDSYENINDLSSAEQNILADVLSLYFQSHQI